MHILAADLIATRARIIIWVCRVSKELHSCFPLSLSSARLIIDFEVQERNMNHIILKFSDFMAVIEVIVLDQPSQITHDTLLKVYQQAIPLQWITMDQQRANSMLLSSGSVVAL